MEIKEIKTGQNDIEVTFKNGSTFVACVAGEQSRGIRSTILIIDEFRLVAKDVIDKILSPTEISRQCPYLKFKEYEYLREEPREIYLSSAYYKSSWMWDEIRLAVSKFYNKGIEEAIFFSTDYSVTLKHGIKTKKALQRARQQSDEYSWMMEQN